ncbi:MAG: DUF692 domain-containing protein [Nitrospiraceae bacterium]
MTPERSRTPLKTAPRGPIPTEVGIGLRFQHHQAVLDSRPKVGWLEVHTENYMGGGKALRYLDAIRKDYPISLHGVGLSLGTGAGLDTDLLTRTRDVIARVEPCMVSEHLSWSSVGGIYLADLLPLPMTEEALDEFCANVDIAQSHLNRRILIENPSSYMQFRHSTIPEPEFLAAVAARTGCGILCDINNIYVSACNHGWSAKQYLNTLPRSAIGEIHLAGHTAKTFDDGRVIRIDDHGSRVAPAVWALYEDAIKRMGRVPTLIEWDTNVPSLEVLVDEASQAAARLAQASVGDENADAA